MNFTNLQKLMYMLPEKVSAKLMRRILADLLEEDLSK